MLRKQKQKEQEFKSGLDYAVILRSAWATRALKRRGGKGEEGAEKEWGKKRKIKSDTLFL